MQEILEVLKGKESLFWANDNKTVVKLTIKEKNFLLLIII